MIRTAFLITALVGLTACGGSQPSRNLEAAKSAPRATAISSVISSKSAKQLFGAERDGLKLTLLDKPLRRIIVSAPAILLGWRPSWLGEAGFHQLDAEAFAIDIDEAVILDGEAFPPGRYVVGQGPELTFVTP